MPRQLVARECMISPDTKHVNKSNFFACIPNTETWGTEMYDAVKASVCLCLREAKIREIPSVAFSVSTPPKEFPPAEYTKLLVETAKGFLESEGQSTKLQRVVFCAKDGIHINGFVEALQNAFNRKTVQVSGSICGSSNVLSYSELTKNTDSNMYCTTTDLDDIEPEKDNRTTVDVNLVNDDITAVKVDAIFLPAREPVSLPQNISNMNSNACTTGNIKEHLQTKFPSGLATGEITSVTLDGFICDLAYFANLGPPTKNTDIRRKVLDTVIRGVLDRCIEDEIEALAIIPYGIGIYLLTEVIFNTLQPFLCENCILERIDIIVDPRDRSSYLPFEEMKRQFYDKVTPHDGIDSPKNEDSQLGGNVTNTPLTAEESNESLSFSEGTVKVDLLMGDITKETTDVIVNSVHGNLDLSASRLVKAVSDAAGTDIQKDLKTKQNLSNIRRDGVVVTGPGKLKCKFIFHVKLKGSIEGWKTVISICLQHAETIGMTSLAFPALGTGRKGIKPHFFAKSVLKCIRKFSATNPKSLHEIRIVIFEEAMFQKVLQTANAFRARKRRHTLKDKFYEMLKKESPRQVEDEVRLQVYTVVDNVDNVKKQLDKLCLKASSEG